MVSETPHDRCSFQRWSQLCEWFPSWETLLDEELDAAAQEELFAQMDGRPGAWKLCALALLEELWLQRRIRALVDKVGNAATEPRFDPVRNCTPIGVTHGLSQACPSSAETRRSWVGTVGRPLAVAVTLLLAFALGWCLSGFRSRLQSWPENPSKLMASGNRVPSMEPPLHRSTSASPSHLPEAAHPPLVPTLDNGNGGAPRSPSPEETHDEDWQWLTIPLPIGESATWEPTRLPVRVVRWDDESQSEESDEFQRFVQAVNDQGGSVRVWRKWVSVELEPQVYAIVPIDECLLQLPENVALSSLFSNQ